MKLNKKNFFNFILLGVVILFISGCTATASIEDIKHLDYEGKTVTATGTVQNTIKLGELSGYTLKDKTDTIIVSSQALPKEGDTISVTGTLIRDSILGYYIKVD